MSTFSRSLAADKAAVWRVVDGTGMVGVGSVSGVGLRCLLREKGGFFFPQRERVRRAETTVIPVESRQ